MLKVVKMEFVGMKSKEFAAGLADVMEVSQTEIATVDRALAKAGIRKISRGRFRPDVTLREGVQIVCGWAASSKLTNAAEEVKRLEHYHPDEIPEDEYENIRTKAGLFGSDFGEEERDLYGNDFFEVMSEVARWLGGKKLNAEGLWISIEKSGAPSISYQIELFKKRKLDFVWFGKLNLFDPKKVPPASVIVTTSIRGTVLKWIFDVTEGGKV